VAPRAASEPARHARLTHDDGRLSRSRLAALDLDRPSAGLGGRADGPRPRDCLRVLRAESVSSGASGGVVDADRAACLRRHCDGHAGLVAG